MRVLFVVMPWCGIRASALGVSTLKAILERDGEKADVVYLNIRLATKMGAGPYQEMAEMGGGPLSPEIYFRAACSGEDAREFASTVLPRYYRRLNPEAVRSLAAEWAGEGGAMREFLARAERFCGETIPAFIEEAVRTVAWEEYDIIGMPLMFDQTCASVCLAQRIKRLYPVKRVIFGGAGCSGVMGEAMVREFDCVDVVVRGEADKTITELVRALRGGGRLDHIPGLVYRDGAVRETGTAPAPDDLDALPVPSHEDYLEQIRALPEIEPSLYFESSRGCWWGEKHPCRFCALNGAEPRFRSKSPGRALAELHELDRRYGIRRMRATDNVLSPVYLKTLMPDLAELNSRRAAEERWTLFYELRTHLDRENLALLKAAGVDQAQAGVESLNDHILAEMNKGATTLQQIQFLRWADELGIAVNYGVIYGNPGERAEDYEEMTKVIDFVDHLNPPSFTSVMALERFSPYFEAPERYGITNIRPEEGLGLVYPAVSNAGELAYRFAYDHASHADGELWAAIGRCRERLQRWRREYRAGRLLYAQEGPVVEILDQRGETARGARLEGVTAEIFLACDRARNLRELKRVFPRVHEGELEGFLSEMMAHRLMYHDEAGHYLSLPLRSSSALQIQPDGAGRASVSSGEERERAAVG